MPPADDLDESGTAIPSTEPQVDDAPVPVEDREAADEGAVAGVAPSEAQPPPRLGVGGRGRGRGHAARG